jgi:hypothetical protein
MNAICILDTCTLTNILNIPKKNQDRDAIMKEFKNKIVARETFLLPLAAIFETGNHIANCKETDCDRHKLAKAFVNYIAKALTQDETNLNPTFQPILFPEEQGLLSWLNGFPKKAVEKITFSDLAITEDVRHIKALNPRKKVYLWTLDEALKANV